MNLALALRLVLRGDRAGRVRLLLMTTGVALGVALLLGVTGALPASDTAALRDVAGVRAVIEVESSSLLRAGQAPSMTGEYVPSQALLNAVVADCAELTAVLTAALEGCRPGQVQLIALDFGPGEAQIVGDVAGGGTTPAGRLQLLDLQGALVPGGTYLVPPELLPELSSSYGRSVLVATDGSDRTVEAVRSALGDVTTYSPPLTPAEAVRQASASTDAYRTAALVGVVAVVLVGGLTLAVSTADGLRERQRPHAALVALGAPLSLLRRSVLLQVATPLLLTVALAVAVAALASSAYLRLGAVGGDVLPLPWTGYAVIAATAVAATLLATAATLPLVRAAGRPDALRAE